MSVSEKKCDKYKLYLTHNKLKVCNIQQTAEFYQKHFGMKIITKVIKHNDENKVSITIFLGYDGKEGDLYSTNSAFLELSSTENVKSPNKPTTTEEGSSTENAATTTCNNSDNNQKTNKTDLNRKINCDGQYSVYWKIGINVYDLKYASERLRNGGVQLGETLDIPDVGVLCHVYDNEGYDTELMQFTMSDTILPYQKLEGCTLGQAAIFSVITLRIRDIYKSLRFYCDFLGMKLLCKQDQSSDYGFDVYYLGFTEETPPNPNDPNAVINREWTYQRPYTLLELLVYTKGQQPQPFTDLSLDEYGFLGLGVACDDLDGLKKHIIQEGAKYDIHIDDECHSAIFNTASLTIRDPDDVPIQILQTIE